jgi:hypothetical protein
MVVVNSFNRLLKGLVKCCWGTSVCHPPCALSEGINAVIERVCSLKEMCKCGTEQIRFGNSWISLLEVAYVLHFIINILHVWKQLFKMLCILKMDAAGFPETNVPVLRTTLRHVPEDHILNLKW